MGGRPHPPPRPHLRVANLLLHLRPLQVRRPFQEDAYPAGGRGYIEEVAPNQKWLIHKDGMQSGMSIEECSQGWVGVGLNARVN